MTLLVATRGVAPCWLLDRTQVEDFTFQTWRLLPGLSQPCHHWTPAGVISLVFMLEPVMSPCHPVLMSSCPHVIMFQVFFIFIVTSPFIQV